MKSLLLTCLIISGTSIAQRGSNCTLFFEDDFSIISNWTIQNNGGVTLNGADCSISAYCGEPNKVYQTLPGTLPDNMWHAETDFHLNSQNTSGHGTGGYIIALTAGDLDFLMEPSGGSFYETDQDGLGVIISGPISNNDLTTWFFLIEDKKGTVRTWDINLSIPLVAGVLDYYVDFDRTSASNCQLAIYSDVARTQHIPGSPVNYTIDPQITGLTTIQHSLSTSGDPIRYFNGRFDNDLICLPSNGLFEQDTQESTSVTALLFPNPASDNFQMQLSNNTIAKKIILRDIAGNRVAEINTEQFGQNNFLFPDHVSSGIYFAEIITEQEQHIFCKIQKSER